MKLLSNTYGSTIVILPQPSVKVESCLKFSSSEFLSAVSHELKTPIAAILGMSDILKDNLEKIAKRAEFDKSKSLDDSHSQLLEESCDFVKEINNVAAELNELVRDLLDAGQVSSGNFSVDLTKEVDVSDFVGRAIRLNKDYALKRGVKISAEVAADLKPIKLDAKRMKQILTNLVSNSVKYSSPNTEVKITAQKISEDGKDFLQIAVIDQGFGMTKEQIEIAFTKYGTINNKNSGSVDSFGLGLPIVKQLIDLQNGEIAVESKPNQGTAIGLKFQYS